MLACLLAMLLCSTLGVAHAAAEDPPARVGRVSIVGDGADILIEPSLADWESAALNTPVSTGTSLRTASQVRAEVRIGSASLQMNANSQLAVQTLDDQSLVLVLQRGNIALNLRDLAAGERVEVHAEDAIFTLGAPGSYHFGHAPAAHRFEVRVFEGAGTLTAASASSPLPLGTGQQARVDSRTLAVMLQGDALRTPFDEWAAQRARRTDRVAVAGRVSAEMTGAEELEDHGRWRVEPRVGAVWYPNAVDAEWAPYRAGRWAWVAPWGWTWIDDAPWGFAPFHYGRWLFLAGRWGWVPGTYAARPAFAPALVGFYGAAPAAGAPWVGWFPLAPGEPYRPGFVASAAYVQRLNVGASAPVGSGQGSYRYAQTSFAATAVTREAFGAATTTARASRVPLSPAALSVAGVLATHGAPAPAPTRAAGTERALVRVPSDQGILNPDTAGRAVQSRVPRDGSPSTRATAGQPRDDMAREARSAARRAAGPQAKGDRGKHRNPAAAGSKRHRAVSG